MEIKDCPRPAGGEGAYSLDTYQRTLSVGLIATPRKNFVTCTPDQSVSTVVEFAREGGFDYVPIAAHGNIVGVLDVLSMTEEARDRSVEEEGDPLSEKHLIGADTSILDFIVQAEEHPFRLLITDQGISGLVSISDIQQLAARAALFALVTQLEISMMDAIRTMFPNGTWQPLITEDRLGKAWDLWNKARESSRHVDLLTYTQFCDKAKILESVVDSLPRGMSKKKYRTSFERYRRLRDALAHANSIEASARTCQTVSSMREWIERLEEIS